MALLKPFRALRYDVRRAGPLDDLVAPPYDVITSALRAELLAASPYNCARLIRPDDPGEAARTLTRWRADGVIVREPEPAVWLLEEAFTGSDRRQRTRRGLVARVRLEPYSAGRILPHERTFPAPKKARLRLLRAVRTKLSPLLLLHEGPPPAAAPDRAPELEATLAGARSRLWRIDDPRETERAIAAVEGRLIIADGHHRFETALRFHEEEGGEETEYVLAALVSRHDEGVAIAPTHRIAQGPVPDLNGGFRVTELGEGAAQALARLADLPRDRPAFVLLRRGRTLLVEAPLAGAEPLGSLDTAAIDRLPLGPVSFTASAAEAERSVASGQAEAAFLVRAPTIEQVEAVALAGETMPQKSTYFFPKLTSGFVFSPFDE